MKKKGLLPLIERDQAGRRLFSEDQLTLLQIIMHLKHTQMPISSIKQFVDWVVEGDRTVDLRLEMMEKHKQAVLQTISLMTDSLQGIDAKITRYINKKNKGKGENE